MNNQNARREITPELLRRLLIYYPETGELVWKDRDVSLFSDTPGRTAAHACAFWNSRYAGTPALCADKGDGYRHGTLLYRNVEAHRAAWAIYYGVMPLGVIDHEDGNPSNNRIGNLRDVTQGVNARNSRAHRKSSGLPPGVKFYAGKQGKPYQARICRDGVSKSLGYFATQDEAHGAYMRAAKVHGFSARHGSD